MLVELRGAELESASLLSETEDEILALSGPRR